MDNLGQPLNPLSSQIQQAQAASHDLSQRQARKGKSKKYLILLAILAIGALGVFLIIKGISSGESSGEPSPSATTLGFVKTPSPTPTAESQSEVDKATVDIQILNGTGIGGEAKFLQTKLEALGYKKIEAGNADKTTYEDTQVTFSSEVPESVVKEITQLLESTYKKVTAKTSKTLKVDVQIITGLRSGQTPKASASATPAATPSSTSSPTPTPTSTP